MVDGGGYTGGWWWLHWWKQSTPVNCEICEGFVKGLVVVVPEGGFSPLLMATVIMKCFLFMSNFEKMVAHVRVFFWFCCYMLDTIFTEVEC